MNKISEQQINSLTRKHIARVLNKLEQEYDVPYWIKQEIKKEFWLHNQNLKEKLYKLDIISLDDTENPWNPDKEDAETTTERKQQ